MSKCLLKKVLKCYVTKVHVFTGADPGFQVRGCALKKIASGGAKILGVFRVKNHDYTPKNHIFSNFRGDIRSKFGISF